MLGELVEAITKLFEFSDRFESAGEKNRQRISKYFHDISACLQKIADQLKSGKVPNQEWGELSVYAEDWPKIIGEIIGQDRANEISNLLASTIKKTPQPSDREAIKNIEIATGQFKGLANIADKNKIQKSFLQRRTFLSVTALAGLTAGSLVTGFSVGKKQDGGSNPTSTKFRWIMEAFLGKNVEKTILYKAPQMICDRIRTKTNGAFNIELKRTGETEAILRKVNDGSIECGYAGIYYSSPLYKALFFGCAIPFGLDPQEQNVWLSHKKNPDDELTFIQSIYPKVGLQNVIPLPAGATGAQMGGWFKKKISSVSDLKGRVMRIPGLGADVMQNLGMIPHTRLVGQPVSLDEAIRRLSLGKFDAVEWIGPYDDLNLGLAQAANFYYYPGWWEPGTTFDVQVNTEAWKNLPQSYQEIFKVACSETHMDILAEYNRENRKALLKMPPNVELVAFSEDILQAARKETEVVLNLYAAQNDVFKEVYQEWQDFKEQMAWLKNLNKP